MLLLLAKHLNRLSTGFTKLMDFIFPTDGGFPFQPWRFIVAYFNKRCQSWNESAVFCCCYFINFACYVFSGRFTHKTGRKLIFMHTFPNNLNFFFVFTIIFPAFTGLAAGLGFIGRFKRSQKIDSQRNILGNGCWHACLYCRCLQIYNFSNS